MSTIEEEKKNDEYAKMKAQQEYEERIKNAEPRYMEPKKLYLLASNQESLQALMEDQENDLTRVLIELKTEHDQINLETSKIQNMIDEYDKRIKMLQSADQELKEQEEEQKKEFEFMDNGINSKKERKNEEQFTQKSLIKQREKLNKDIFIIQKEIIKYENESQMLDKKMDRAAIDENIIKEKKNKVYSKTEDQKHKNASNQNENDLKMEEYKKIIELKKAFLKFSDDRKAIQEKIAEQAKNDSQDKQEVEKRKTLKLLMLYNQYLRTLMDEELKQNEVLERVFEEIRDIVGTKDLNTIVDFLTLRNKRYNYACYEVRECEDTNKYLKKEIKELKKELTELKNSLLVAEKGEDGRELDVDSSTTIEEEVKVIEEEKEKNKNLLILGKKYNDVDEAYQTAIQNISAMIENEKKNPLNVKIDDVEEKKEESQQEGGQQEEGQEGQKDKKEEDLAFKLTNNELKSFKDVHFDRKEREDLDKFNLTEEEELIVNNTKLTEKEKKDMEKNELSILDKIIKKKDLVLSEEELEILEKIEETELNEEEINSTNISTLTEMEISIATQKLKDEYDELKPEEKEKRIKRFKELKLKYRKYKPLEKKENTKYKIKKMKKNKVDMIKDYELLLKKVSKTFDALYLIHNKQEFLNLMKEKGVDANKDSSSNLQRKNTKRGTKRLGDSKKYLNTENYKIISEETNEEEDDKSNYDPDAKILSRFLGEQKKEKDNFVSGKTKIEEKK